MKKYFYFLLFALMAMVFTGCSSDDDFTPDTPEGETFTASIEEASRTMLNGRKVTWLEGDVVNFVTGSNNLAAPYSVAPIGDGSIGLLSPTGTNKPKTPYEAYYPKGVWAQNQQGVYTSALDYRQDYESENDISGVNPMYANSSTTLLTFKNICGMLKLKLKGTAKVSRIQVTDGDYSLSGSFSLNNDMAVISSDAVRAGIYLNCGEGIQLTPEGKDFCISIPAGRTYNKLVIKVYDTDEGYYTMRISNATVDRNNIYTIEKTPKFKPVPAPVMPGAFSVSDDNGKTIRYVYFSRGNLYWDAIREQFDLEVNQQDYLPVPVRGYWAHYDPSHVCHFYFSPDPAKSYADTYDSKGEKTTDIIFAHGMEMYGTTWQVLTQNEWVYLMNRVSAVNGKALAAGKAVEIDNEYVIGMFLYPDDYVGNKDEDTWKEIEDAHIVILPVSGGARADAGAGSTMSSIGQQGTYMGRKLISWNTTTYGGYYFKTHDQGIVWERNTISFNRSNGISIRLVTEENPNEE